MKFLWKHLYTDVIQSEYIYFLFNLCISHGHLPCAFMHTSIVPLVKSKSGDLTDINNYRAITLSNSITKILESCFIRLINSYSDFDKYQFGFKANHSTAHCTNVMKKVVQYYTTRGSHVFVSFVDFSKAFDKVNYWKLFNKLLDDKIDTSIISLLAYWYSHQSSSVRWKCVVSDCFSISNGTRQGSLLSPFLFARYIRELIADIASCNIGCNIGGIFCNILAYADDIVLLAPSWAALQQLIDLLARCAKVIDMSCNIDKTVCMIFRPTCNKKALCCEFPPFSLDGRPLKYVQEFKYLGHVINNSQSDDADIKREIRNLFVRTNILIRRFAKCSIEVKRCLFKAYCMCLYDAALWNSYSNAMFNKMRSCYNKCIKSFFGYGYRDSVTTMLLELQLPGFTDFFNQYVSSFRGRWLTCANLLVKQINCIMP
jgi:Reverse transcriptase (RNA-dependent DNA polymerase)